MSVQRGEIRVRRLLQIPDLHRCIAGPAEKNIVQGVQAPNGVTMPGERAVAAEDDVRQVILIVGICNRRRSANGCDALAAYRARESTPRRQRWSESVTLVSL